MLERRWLETVDRSFAACRCEDEIALCARADDVIWSEIGRNQVANVRQAPETVNARSLLWCVADDLIGRMVDSSVLQDLPYDATQP